MAKQRRKAKQRNPSTATIAAIVAGGAGAIALGSLVVYALRSSRRAGLPPEVKVPLPPRANGMPEPDPIAPKQVPSSVTTAASSMAPAAPSSSGSTPSPIDYQGADWTTYGWYTYKGNAPQKMWIRVDWKDNATKAIQEQQNLLVATDFITRPYQFRWVVIMGEDTPMAQGVLDRSIRVPCGGATACGRAWREIPTGASLESFYRTWIMPVLGKVTARAAADWIDIAYGG